MQSIRLVLCIASLALLAACSDDDEKSGGPIATSTPTFTATSAPVPSATPTVTRQPSPTATATTAATDTPTTAPTDTPTTTPETDTPTTTPTGTPTPTATATPTGDPSRCRSEVAEALSACIFDLGQEAESCFLQEGRICPDSEFESSGFIDLAVEEGCPDAATVRAAGYGDLATPESLRERLTAQCRAEVKALAVRTFGGPHGVAIGTTNATIRDCLSKAHSEAVSMIGSVTEEYADCIEDERAGGPTCQQFADAFAADAEERVAREVSEECPSLSSLIALDPVTYAARAGAQARCLVATAEPDTSPFSFDCGPRESLIDTPRGQYVQVVLDEETYGTRCGDGSEFAFWIRLAPEGEPVENVVVGMQGGGVCIFNDDCRTRPADLFEALSDQPEQGGPLSNDPEISPFANWTKVYLPYCNQDVFIGGGTTSAFPDVTVHRFGAVNVRAALRYVRDVIWRELDRTSEEGYQPDRMRVLFGGFSAGGFGTLYNYHYVLDDLQWAHTAAYPDASLALDNGETLGVGNLGLILIADVPPVGWGAQDYLPPYCIASNCGVGPVLLQATAPRLKAVPEQQFLILSNQIDQTQVFTTFFDSTADWVNAMREQYCATRNLNGVQYFLPAIPMDVHVISARNELYTGRAVDGEVMRDWLAGGFSAPDAVVDRVEEGTLVQAFPGVEPFDCPVSP